MDFFGHLAQVGPQILEVLNSLRLRGGQLFFNQRCIQGQRRKPLRQIVMELPGKPPELFFLGVDNSSGELAEILFLAPQGILRLLTLADVYGHAHHAAWFLRRGCLQAATGGDPAHTPVGTQDTVLDDKLLS